MTPERLSVMYDFVIIQCSKIKKVAKEKMILRLHTEVWEIPNR